MHQAASWRRAYRLILVVVDQPDPATGQLDLFPNHFFLLTSWGPDEKTADELLEHYRRRGTFEDRFGEFNAAINLRLSSPNFADNEATLLLGLLAFNLAGMLRGEMEDGPGSCGWDLGRLQKTVLKAGARLVRGGHRLLLSLAASAAPLWRRLIDKIQGWRLANRWGQPSGPRRRLWVPPPAHAHLSLILRC